METKYKTFRTELLAKIQLARKLNNKELEIFTEELLKDYDIMQNEKKVEVNLESWRGRDNLKYVENNMFFEIEIHQRPDKDSEVKTTKKIITKEEINQVIKAINLSSKRKDKEGNEYTETPEIARCFCLVKDLRTNSKGISLYPNGEFFFGHFFEDRKLHNNLNICLRLLDYYKIIKYRGKRSFILNNQFKFE